MSRYARRKDTNHNPICNALVSDGYLYHDVSRLPGFVDAIIGGEGHCPHCSGPIPKVLLVEIKSLGGKLGEDQGELQDKWGESAVVAFTKEDVTRRFK